MPGEMTVTYFYHSGFSVTVGSRLLVFDYWEGDEEALPEDARLCADDLKAYSQIVFFVSHSHPDHFDQAIYRFGKELPITYVVSDDTPIGTRGKRMKAGDTLSLNDMTVRAFDSTDLGVSFLVEVGGLKIFHAGDLNLWHWREESTFRQITQAENAFYAAVEPLVKEKIDLCMFPVDPRMGGMFDAGANYFIMAVKPRLFIPMHWQGRAEVATDFARRARTRKTEVLALTMPRERAELTFEEDELSIHVFTPVPRAEQEAQKDEGIRLAFSPDDPFSDTDLPVDIPFPPDK